MGRNTSTCLAILALIGLGIAFPLIPLWQVGLPALISAKIFPAFLIGTAFSLFVGLFTRSKIPEIIAGGTLCIWVFGSAGIALLFIPLIWALLLSFVGQIY